MTDPNEKMCLTCEHCIYICEGDYICDVEKIPVLIMEEHCPNENYWYCASSEWVSKYD